MSATAPALARLRGSVFGAWFAVAYALAMLAAALAPTPAQANPLLFQGAMLCSGAMASGQDMPEATGEPSHCKGCPLNPVLAAPGALQPCAPMRLAMPLAPTVSRIAGLPQGAPIGLQPSRAPPACSARA